MADTEQTIGQDSSDIFFELGKDMPGDGTAENEILDASEMEAESGNGILDVSEIGSETAENEIPAVSETEDDTAENEIPDTSEVEAKTEKQGTPHVSAPEAEMPGDAGTEAPEASASAGEAKQAADAKEKKFFGKKKDKAKSQMELKISELEEQRVRQLAEFENFRKRSEREKSQMFEMGAKDVIEKILPVIDNFERGLMGVSEEQREEPFVQGMELVYKQIMTAFEALGVKPIEAVGQEFDPGMHNAVMMVDDDSLESGTVAEELQKGYMYKDSVVRHSMVKVVN